MMLRLLIAALLLYLTRAKFIDSLTYDDLSTVLRAGPTLLVFTVSWCPHCKEVLPEIAILAKAVKKNDGITVARVDGDAEPAILTKFQVESFPTFLYFPPAYDLRTAEPSLSEFSDYRWAELMAEFVNNETDSATIELEPRAKFLAWRKKVPYNKGKQPRQVHERAPTPTPHPHGLDPIIGMDADALRDPLVLTAADFERTVHDADEGVAVYFYARDDFMQRDFLIQWRQASSAYSVEDRVTLAMFDVGPDDNAEIARKYGATDTPHIAYFPRCSALMHGKQRPLVDCKKPSVCDGCADTDQILEFISRQGMLEMGLDPDAEAQEGDDVMTLSTEEYEKLVKEGKITPLDPNDPDAMKDESVEYVEGDYVEEGDDVEEGDTAGDSGPLSDTHNATVANDDNTESTDKDEL